MTTNEIIFVMVFMCLAGYAMGAFTVVGLVKSVMKGIDAE